MSEQNSPETPNVEVNESGDGGSVRVDRDTFIEAWERGCAEGIGVKGVAERLGLKESSVQQRATKYRNPPTKKKVKQEDGSFVTVEIPESERLDPVPLSHMPKGGGARFDAKAANSTLEAIRAKIAAEQAEANKETAGSEG